MLKAAVRTLSKLLTMCFNEVLYETRVVYEKADKSYLLANGTQDR